MNSMIGVSHLVHRSTAWVHQGHCVKYFIQELQSPVKVDLDPTWRLFDALTRVVWTPAFHKTHPQDAESPEVIYSNAGSCRITCVNNRKQVN